MSRRSRHRAAIAKSRRPIAAPANVRIVAAGSVRPSAIAALRLLGLALPAGGELPQPPDPPDGLGVEPPSAVGLSGQGDRLPGHLVQHHAVALGAIGDAVERDGLAIQDELELMGQQRRVSLAHLGVEGLQVEAVDRVGDQAGRAVVAGDGEVEGLQRLARRRAVVPSRNVVGLPARRRDGGYALVMVGCLGLDCLRTRA